MTWLVQPHRDPSFTRAVTRRATLIFVLVLGALAARPACASHFRFAHVTWTRVAGTTVHFTVTQAWRADDVSNLDIDFGDGGIDSASFQELGTSTDLAGESFTVTRYEIDHTYEGEGPWIASLNDCCRISTLKNAADESENIQTVVDLRNGNTGSPVSAIPVIVQMPQGGPYALQLPVTDPDGDPVSCRMATSDESGIPTVATTSAGGAVLQVSQDCRLSWDTSGATTGDKYAAQVVIEENHAGNTSSVALDFIIEIAAPGSVPSCAGPTGTTALSVGQPFTGTFTGSDANGDALKVSVPQGLPPGAQLTPAVDSQGPSPFTVTMNWTPRENDLGKAYAVLVVFTDAGGLQGSCAVSLRVTNCGDGVVDAGEACDDGNHTACDGCTNCHVDRCGDGTKCVDEGEECDDGNTSSNDGCSATCKLQGSCGDGHVDAAEQCDAGADNGGVSCCASDCTLRSAGTVCRAASRVCDVAETCDGSSVACPADGFVASNTSCADPECSVAGSCQSGQCTEAPACNAVIVAGSGTVPSRQALTLTVHPEPPDDGAPVKVTVQGFVDLGGRGRIDLTKPIAITKLLHRVAKSSNGFTVNFRVRPLGKKIKKVAAKSGRRTLPVTYHVTETHRGAVTVEISRVVVYSVSF